MSHVTCHLSHVACHVSPFFFFIHLSYKGNFLLTYSVFFLYPFRGILTLVLQPMIVMNLPAERGWVSKNLPRGPRAEGHVFIDPPELSWQVHRSCSSNRMLEQFPAVAAAVAAESFTTEQVCKIFFNCAGQK